MGNCFPTCVVVNFNIVLCPVNFKLPIHTTENVIKVPTPNSNNQELQSIVKLKTFLSLNHTPKISSLNNTHSK